MKKSAYMFAVSLASYTTAEVCLAYGMPKVHLTMFLVAALALLVSVWLYPLILESQDSTK